MKVAAGLHRGGGGAAGERLRSRRTRAFLGEYLTMCHGNSCDRAAVPAPDLLRDKLLPQIFQEKTFNELLGFNSCTYGTDMMDEDFSTGVKKLDSMDNFDEEGDKLGRTGPISAWFDCMVRDHQGGSVTSSVTEKEDSLAEETGQAVDFAPRSRKARKFMDSEDRTRGMDDSDINDAMPTSVDEKRKRRMSSNRASAQRSRQRKQERLDELEVLTAQLRVENSTLLRRSKLAVQLAKKYEGERNGLAKKMEKLARELEVVRQLHPANPGTGEERVDNHREITATISAIVTRMVGGGTESPVEPVVKIEESSGDENPDQKLGVGIAPQIANSSKTPESPPTRDIVCLPQSNHSIRTSLIQPTLGNLTSGMGSLTTSRINGWKHLPSV